MNLQAYRFETNILEGGIIQIPELKSHINQEVEIFF